MKKRSLVNRIKNEYLGKAYVTFCGVFIVILTIAIIGFIATKGLSTFYHDKHSIIKFLFSEEWKPDREASKGGPVFGALVFIKGSTLISTGAVVLSAPISVAVAIFINMISPKLGKKFLQPALELFVGIPSVVYGWLGISILIPLIKHIFGGIGFSALAGIIVLSIMILPTIASISSDAIKSIPRDYLEASYGLGATRWQTIKKVVIPASRSGILTGIVLGLARAFGEALAVQMVIGNSIKSPNSLLSTASTLTSIITMDMANTTTGSEWNNAMWSLALLLLIISFIFIVIIRLVEKKGDAK